jgi:hypothetical protein
VNHAQVEGFLDKGSFDYSEDAIQLALEQILNVPFHKEDWGGEMNDLYTANVVINDKRTATVFLLKGNGLRKRTMELSDLGKNGDQLQRLFDIEADLYVVQFVGIISERVIKETSEKVDHRRSQGKRVSYCIIDGQDTAMLLYAYGKLGAGQSRGN